MKKFLSVFLIFLTLSSVFVFADSKEDPFDNLVEKLLKDFDDENSTMAVKIFNASISANEKKKVSKSVQFALFCTDKVEIVSSVEDADYVCSGNIEVDGPNYIVSAKITDNYDGTTVAKARQKVPKKYYEDEKEATVTQVVVDEDEVDAGDVLGAVILGSIIGGVFHELTTPPPPRPRPSPARPPRRPHP